MPKFNMISTTEMNAKRTLAPPKKKKFNFIVKNKAADLFKTMSDMAGKNMTHANQPSVGVIDEDPEPNFIHDEYMPPLLTPFYYKQEGTGKMIKDWDIPERYTPNPLAGQPREEDTFDDWEAMEYENFSSRKDMINYKWKQVEGRNTHDPFSNDDDRSEKMYRKHLF